MSTTVEAILFIACFIIIPSAAWCISKRSIKVIWQGPFVAVGIAALLVAFLLIFAAVIEFFPWLFLTLIILNILMKLFGKKD